MRERILSILLLIPLLTHPVNAAATPRTPVVFEARPAREVLPVLGERLGTTLKVDPALADEKLTLRLARPDLASMQRALRVAVDGVWKTRTVEGKTEQWLCPSAERTQVLARLRQSRAARLQEQAEALKSSLRFHDQPNNPNAERGALSCLPQAYDLLRTFPEGALERALAHPNPPFNGSEGSKVPGIAVPLAVLSADARDAASRLLRYLGDRLDRSKPGRGENYRRLAADPAGMKAELWATSAPSTGGGTSLYLSLRKADGTRAADVLLAFASLPRATAPQLSGNSPQTGVGGTLHEAREQRTVTIPVGRYRHDHLLATIAKVANLETVSDYYTKGTVTTISPGPKRLEELLQGFDRIYRCHHYWVGDVLVFRSENWEALAEAEPPAAVTDRLEQAVKDPKTLRIEDLVFAVQRADEARLATLEHYTSPTGKALPLHLVPRLRMNAAWLRAYGALSSAKRLPVPKNGLYLARLPRTARSAWEDVFFQAGLLTETEMAAARLKPAAGMPFPDWPAVGRYVLDFGSTAPPADLWRAAVSY